MVLIGQIESLTLLPGLLSRVGMDRRNFDLQRTSTIIGFVAHSTFDQAVARVMSLPLRTRQTVAHMRLSLDTRTCMSIPRS